MDTEVPVRTKLLGPTLFENAARVPLIIAGPGVEAAGRSSANPVEMVDFYPTLTQLAGVATPSHAMGASLAPVLKDVGAKVREAALTQFADGYSIRTDRYRYTEWSDNGGGAELYDHQTDPREMNNLASRPGQQAIIEKLSKLLRQRVEAIQEAPEGVRQIRPRDR